MSVFLYMTFAITFFITTAKCQNYCASSLCGNDLKHIACGNKGKFAARCPSNTRMIPSSTLKQTVVELHNEKRNFIAGGQLDDYQSAVRMGTMQWDDELAKLAALNVKQCQIKHDECRNTFTYKESAQNLAIIFYAGAESTKSDEELLENCVNTWWNEYKHGNMDTINNHQQYFRGPMIGHFTVFVTDRNIRCGCAAIRYKTDRYNSYLLACNYATANIFGLPIYEGGAPASKCTTGTNPTYPSLCSVNEEYAGL